MYKHIFLLLFPLLLSGSCNTTSKQVEQEEEDIVVTDLPQLKAQGEITAVTLYSSTSYFQYAADGLRIRSYQRFCPFPRAKTEY